MAARFHGSFRTISFVPLTGVFSLRIALACSQVMTVFEYQIEAGYLRGVSRIAAPECSFVASSVCVFFFG